MPKETLVFRRYAEKRVQPADHVQGRRSLGVEHFVDAVEAAEGRLHVRGRKVVLLHAEQLDDGDGVGRVHGMAPALVGFMSLTSCPSFLISRAQ